MFIDAPARLTLEADTYKAGVFLRLDLSQEVRAITPVVAYNTDSYPLPAREGNYYEICLAYLDATEDGVTVTDTRGDYEVCGFASFTGQPPYQPPGDIPAPVWGYGAFPAALTQKQREAVERPGLDEHGQDVRVFNRQRKSLVERNRRYGSRKGYLQAVLYSFPMVGVTYHRLDMRLRRRSCTRPADITSYCAIMTRIAIRFYTVDPAPMKRDSCTRDIVEKQSTRLCGCVTKTNPPPGIDREAGVF